MERLSIRRRLALEIERRQRKRRKEEHELRQLFWECTLRCNVRCKHCGSDCKQTAGQPDMPAEDFLRVVDNIRQRVDPHRVLIILTGGEPLMRDDIEAIGAELYRREFPWGMVTNGLFLTEERMQRLMASGMHTMTISLDGLRDDHNWMRGHPQSFDRASAAIRMAAAERELTWDVVTCVNRRNYAYLPRLRDYLYGLGVRRWRAVTVFPVGRAARNPELQLTDEEFTGLMDFIAETRREGKMHVSYGCEGFLGRYEGEVRDHFFYCAAGVNVGSVLADGSISACASIRSDYHQGNIYHGDDFMDVWEHRFVPYRDREWMRKGRCGDCKMFRYCEGNGMHLRDGEGNLLVCHAARINPK